jgi:hypothetical protein
MSCSSFGDQENRQEVACDELSEIVNTWSPSLGTANLPPPRRIEIDPALLPLKAFSRPRMVIRGSSQPECSGFYSSGGRSVLQFKSSLADWAGAPRLESHRRRREPENGTGLLLGQSQHGCLNSTNLPVDEAARPVWNRMKFVSAQRKGK